MTDKTLPPTNPFEYAQWRSQFLNVVLRVSCGLGILLIGAFIPSATPNELIALGVVYLILLFITFTPTRHTIKAASFITIGYFIGLFSLTRFGPWSNAAIFFLATNIFASLLFERQVDRWILAFNTITLVIVAVLDTLGLFTLVSTEIPPTDPGNWALYIAGYIILAVAIIWAINLLKQEFKTVAGKFQSTLQLLSRDRAELEQRVEDRTAGLIKKTEQLRAASYIARHTAEVEDLLSLLDIVVNLITDQFGFYHTGIFLLNETGDTAMLQAASSEGGKRMMEKGYSIAVGTQSIIGYAIAQKNYRIALDVGADAVFFDNIDLPATHSEIALPLIIQNRVLGVLDIQSDQPQAFSVEDVDVLQTLADQVAVAIENARLLGESQTALMQLEAVTNFRTREAWTQRLQKQAHAFTYTPLGLRADAIISEEENHALNIPILLRGQNIGAISITRKNDERWNKVDEDMVTEVAYQVGLAIDNIRLLENATQRAQQEKTVSELAARFSQSLDIDSLLQTAARELGQVSEISEVSVFIGEIPEQAPQKRRPKRSTG